MTSEGSGSIMLDPRGPQDLGFGWMFFYNTTKFYTSKNPLMGLAGNGPIVVIKKDGKSILLHTGHPLEAQVDRLKEEHDPPDGA